MITSSINILGKSPGNPQQYVYLIIVPAALLLVLYFVNLEEMWEMAVNVMKNKNGFVLLSLLFYFAFFVVSSSQCPGTDEIPVCPLIPERRDVSSLSK